MHQIEIISDPLKARKSISIAKDRRIKKLEEELADARADMGAITHDQEAANEELQSANEEIVSSNEELQSLNEELETSKEEIESTNEELTTSNHELQARIQQVEELYNYYEGILSTVQEPMLILDKEIRIKSANKAFCKIFHVTEEESIGVSLYKLGNSQWNIPRLRELLEDIVPKNIRFHDFEVEHTFPVIGKKTMLLNAHRVIQQSQNEELIVLTIIDITDVRNLAIQLEVKEKKALAKELELEKKALKKIEDSNKRYNMMLMQSPFAFAVLKGKGMHISLANDSIKEIWGKGKDIEGKPLVEVLPELKGGPLLKLLNKVYSSGKPYHGYEMLVPLKRNGELKDAYFNFVYQPYLEADETISGVTIISTEVTDHVIAKLELIEAKKQAEHKTEIAEVAVKSKQQFLSNMSHEIRTPMNAIIGFTNVVMKTKLNDKQREYLNAIKVSGESLIVLINDILDMAKVDAGKVTFEHIPFYLFSSVSDMLHLFETKMQEKNVVLVKQYDTSIPNLLVGDPMRLRQIILNLMANAVKFSDKGKITVNIKKLEEDTKRVTIKFSISDTGIGIPDSKLKYIFDAFNQVALETNRLYGGAGLGLAIVKQLVELQGGTVSVKSKIDKGSTFSFTLSFDKATLNTAIETGKPDESAQKLLLNKTGKKIVKVLVVEDVPLNQLLIKILVEEFGFSADMAENGKSAIDYLAKNKYDIILMDLQMPVMNGFELTEYIRNVLKSQVPIIALTADVTTVNAEICKSFGMNDYISKPIDENILYTKMKQYL
ncbi:MAG TPA: ATP-binding protein [Ferruginibacter sp.]|nr:ATP-binding protein [Ferruginibacter sp.]